MAFFSQELSVGADDGERNSIGGFNATNAQYPIGEGGGSSWSGIFMRFTLTGVNKGDIISDANIELEARFSESNTVCRARILAEQADDPAAPTTGGEYDTARGASGTEILWLPPAQTFDDTIRTDADVNIDIVIQEIVNRAGWSPGNHILLFIDDSSLTESDAAADRTYKSVEHATGPAPILSFTHGSEELESRGVHLNTRIVPGRVRVI